MSEKTNHVGKPIPKEPDNVVCDICLTEIPESVAVSSEGDEYAQHFCGITCYTKWRDEHSKKEDASHMPEDR